MWWQDFLRRIYQWRKQRRGMQDSGYSVSKRAMRRVQPQYVQCFSRTHKNSIATTYTSTDAPSDSLDSRAYLFSRASLLWLPSVHSSSLGHSCMQRQFGWLPYLWQSNFIRRVYQWRQQRRGMQDSVRAVFQWSVWGLQPDFVQ